MALVSSSVHMAEGASKNDCCQCLYSHSELQLPPAFPDDSWRSTYSSDPGSSQITAPDLGPRVCEILCAPFKSEISISPSPLGLAKVRPACLQSQMLWGFIFQRQDPQTGYPNMGLRLLTLFGEALQCNFSVFVCHSPGDIGILQICLSYPTHCGSFFMLLFRSLIHFEFNFVYGVRECSNFILLHVAVQLSQHQFLKRVSFLHCIFLPPLPKIRWPYVCGIISGICILFHRSIFLFLCLYHTVLITVAL